MSRQSARAQFDIPVRVTLAETDLDTHEVVHDKLADEVASLKKVAVGILISITTGVAVEALSRILK